MRKLYAVLAAIAIGLSSGAGCSDKNTIEPINQGRIIEKNHYPAGESPECKKASPSPGECKTGDPTQYPQKCTYLIEEWETKRRQEVEVACDASFRDSAIGQSWVRPNDPFKK